MASPKPHSWSRHAYGQVFKRCDVCGRRRWWTLYYEMYGDCPGCARCQEKGRATHTSVWWWACTDCLVDALGEKLKESEE